MIKNNFRILKKPHAYLQTILKAPVKFQKDRTKTVGGVKGTRYLLKIRNHAPRTMRHAPRTTRHAPRTTRHAPRPTHHAPRKAKNSVPPLFEKNRQKCPYISLTELSEEFCRDSKTSSNQPW